MSNLVAVFQIGSLGDSIVSLPTLLSIREFIPGCSEYLLISRFDSNLKVLPSDIFDMAWGPKYQVRYSRPESRILQMLAIPQLLAQLRYYRPRYCVSLMPSDREPERVLRDARFFKSAGIKELLGFQSMAQVQIEPASSARLESTESYRKFYRLWGAQAAEKFPKYAKVPLLQPNAQATAVVRKWLDDNRRDPDARLIAIAPYSNYASKDIPEDKLLQLIPRLTEETNAEVVLVGGRKDYARAEKLLGAVPGLNACGLFSVQESAALLKACDLAICTDTGPMHLAAAVGVRLLVTFSRISRQFGKWLPFGQHSTILYRDVPCAGCDSVQCAVPGHPCMENITAEEIFSSAKDILSGSPVRNTTLEETRVLTW